jgi:hypothetical protein
MNRKRLMLLTLLLLLLGVEGIYANEGEISSLPGGGWWIATQVMNVGNDTASVLFTPILSLETGTLHPPSADPVTEFISQNASTTFMPGSYGNLVMDDQYKGSAIISANQPVVAIASIANNLIGGDQPEPIGIEGGRAAAQYSGIRKEDVATTLNFPVVKNDYKDKSTTFYVQTVQAGTIHVTYSMDQGQSTYKDRVTTNVDGQTATFSPSDSGVPQSCTDPDFSCLGAATFTSTVLLAGSYVEHNTMDSPAQTLLSTRGFTPRDFDTTVVLPVIKSMWKGRTTGVQIQNVGDTPSTITFTLAYQNGVVSETQPVRYENVPPGSSVTFFPGNHGIFKGPLPPDHITIDDEFLGAATVTSNQPMVAIENENDFAPPDVTKQTVFAGFPQSIGTPTVLLPLVKEDYNGNQTGIQIANVGTNSVYLEAEYVLDTGPFTVDDRDGPIIIAPGKSYTFYGVTEYWTGYEKYRHGVGAVTIKATPVEGADARIVGIAQEAERLPGGGLEYLDTKNYEGFNQ